MFLPTRLFVRRCAANSHDKNSWTKETLMFLDAIRRLYDYQREVTDHVLNVSAQLSNEEFVSTIVEG